MVLIIHHLMCKETMFLRPIQQTANKVLKKNSINIQFQILFKPD
jgi:hypothetical protein